MAKTPESIAEAQRMKARYPWWPPELVEAWEDPEIMSRQFYERILADTHGKNNPMVVAHPEDERSGLWFPDHTYRYFPDEAGPRTGPMGWDRYWRWRELMEWLYDHLDPEEGQRIQLRFGPYGESDYLVVEISPDGLTPEHWQAACAKADEIARRPPPVYSDEEDPRDRF